jgi:hypothetical protein
MSHRVLKIKKKLPNNQLFRELFFQKKIKSKKVALSTDDGIKCNYNKLALR